MTPEIDPELVQRMVALVRVLADVPKDSVLGQSGYASEARAITALLPEPVDPDLLETRELVAANGGFNPSIARAIRAGEYDETTSIKVPLACLKRGRSLAQSQEVGFRAHAIEGASGGE